MRLRQDVGILFNECSNGSARLLERFHAITPDRPFEGVLVIDVGDVF